MLRALSDSVQAVFTAADRPRGPEEARQLNKCSTALTATITQLAQAVQQP